MNTRLTIARGAPLLAVLALIGVSVGTASGDPPTGWGTSGSDPRGYEYGIDTAVKRGGTTSGLLESKNAAAKEFGTMSQAFLADDYRGKRVRMTAWVKVKDVEKGAALWMRVDGAEKLGLAYDNMNRRRIRGTADWKQYAIVLDVPDDGVMIGFGVMLGGKGRVWVDDFKFEAVDKRVPVTDMKLKPRNEKIGSLDMLPRQPVNLDFENE